MSIYNDLTLAGIANNVVMGKCANFNDEDEEYISLQVVLECGDFSIDLKSTEPYPESEQELIKQLNDLQFVRLVLHELPSDSSMHVKDANGNVFRMFDAASRLVYLPIGIYYASDWTVERCRDYSDKYSQIIRDNGIDYALFQHLDQAELQCIVDFERAFKQHHNGIYGKLVRLGAREKEPLVATKRVPESTTFTVTGKLELDGATYQFLKFNCPIQPGESTPRNLRPLAELQAVMLTEEKRQELFPNTECSNIFVINSSSFQYNNHIFLSPKELWQNDVNSLQIVADKQYLINKFKINGVTSELLGRAKSMGFVHLV